MKNNKLQQLQPKLPKFIQDRIEEVLNEDEAYVADELVELCEAILNEVAAIGFAIYLNQEKQKEVYNDFLIQLFTDKSHAYNAGPLYRWAANMIKDVETEEATKAKHLFWEKDGKELNKAINGLSLLRNKVMHGFFVLPPEINSAEADKIAEVLEEMLKADLFKVLENSDIHFLQSTKTGVCYSGHWGIQDENWEALEKTYRFGELAHAIRFQLSDAFDDAEHNKVMVIEKTMGVSEIEALFTEKQKGAYAVWQAPHEINNAHYYALVKMLLTNDKYATIYYELANDGITFTSDYLLKKMVNKFKGEVIIKDLSSVPKKALCSIAKVFKKQILVVLNHIETALFNENHILHLADFFYENNIILVAFGAHHPWMDRFFNNSITIECNPQIMKSQWKNSLDNYLRFKGPSKEKSEDKAVYDQLLEIGEKLVSELSEKKTVVARRFADEHDYPIEYVHELFGVLSPYYKVSTEPFILDEVDELYGFPKELTESSSIFFALGRRDVKLEYQHKVLSI